MRLHPRGSGDPRAVCDALPAALDGVHPLALGFRPASDDVVPNGTAVVIATSGSSGVPKRVVLSGAALRASAEGTSQRIGSGQWMLALPAAYIAGVQVIARSLLAGFPPVALAGKFSPDAFLQATAQLRRDVDRFTSLVPAQLATLLDAADESSAMREALASYRAILVGGQSLPPVVRQRALDAGVKVVRTYGSSETAGGCVYDGIPLEGVRLGESDGEIRISGAHLATGYLGDVELTEKTFVTDDAGLRWYRTGDAGTIAHDGALGITGRIDNVIVSGGINVSLDRVERVVRGIRGLEHAVVVGIPDERWGEASIVFAAGAEHDDPGEAARERAGLLEQVRERVAAEIGRHARPTRLEVRAELPMLASGKPDRAALRRMTQN